MNIRQCPVDLMKIPRLSFPLTVALLYGILGGLWIIVSDQIAFATTKDFEALSNIQTYKGWLFVLGSSLILFFILRRENQASKKSEVEARMAEERYRTLVEQLPAVVYIDAATNDASTRYISPQIETLMGYTSAEWMADNDLWENSIYPDDHDAVVQEELEARNKEEPFSHEYRLIARDGQVVWVYDHAVLIRDQDGTPLYYQGVLLDTTKQRQAEEAIHQSEERFSKVFEASSIAICITQLKNGQFIDANQAYWNLSGMKPDNALGRSAFELAVWKNTEEHNNLLERLKNNGAVRGMEDKFVTATGEVRDTLIFHELIRLGNQDCILSMFHDITEQNRVQEALHRREGILNAIAFAADQFLKSLRWDVEISSILERIGVATEASRVYIFQKVFEDHTRTLISQRYEWCAADITAQIDNPALQRFDLIANGMERWAKLFANGEPTYGIVRELPVGEQAELVREGILSFIYMPIMIEQEFWGFIGFDDCLTERVWSASEIKALRTAANIIGAAIQQEKSGEAVQKQLKELMMLHAVALTNSTASSMDELITRVTEIINDTLSPDNCGVLLIEENRRFIRPHESYKGNIFYDVKNPLSLDQGIAGKVASTGKSLRLSSASSDSDFVAISPNIQSELCIPIKSGGRVIGIINIETKLENAFTESDERLINTISGGLGTAIDKIKLFEAERRRAFEAEILRDATTALTRSLDLHTLFEVTLDLLYKFASYDSASIFFLQPEGMEMVASRNLPEEINLLGGRIGTSEKWEATFINHRPLVMADAQTDPRFEPRKGTEYIRGWMGVPLIVKDQIIGMLNIDSRKVNAFSEEQATLIQTFANQAAIAIENARLFDAEQRGHQEAETLREAAAAVSTLDQEKAVQSILEQLAKVVPYHSASVQILGDGYLEIVGGVGWADQSSVVGLRFPVPGNNPNSRVIQERRSYLLQDAPSEYESFNVEPHNHIHSWLGVPLMVRDQVIGMLAVDHTKPNFYTPQDIRLAETFANQAAIAIENARLFAGEQNQRLREASMLDLMRLAASSLSLDEVNLTILGHLLKLIRCESGSIQLLKGRRLQVSAVIGYEPDTIQRGNILHLDDFPLNDEIVTQKRPIRIGNVAKDERFRWLPGVDNLRSFLGVPIIFKENVIGIATLESDKIKRFTKEDEDLALAIANNAANAIGNARLFEREQQRRQEAENLRVAASAITSTLDAREVLETILIALKQVVPYYSATMFLLEEDRVKITAAQGLPNPESALNSTFSAENKLFTAIKENNGQPVILYDAQVDPRFEKWAAADNVHGWMGVPLLTRGEIVGFITLDSDAVGTFDENSAALAQTFAYQAAIAIDNARLYEETRRRLEELEVVSRISFALRSTLDPDKMLPTLMKEILKIMNTDAAAIWLYNPATNELDQKIANGWQNQISIKHMRLNESIAGHVYETGEVHVIHDFSLDPYAHPAISKQMGAGWGGIAVPIRTSAQTIGVMIVALLLPRKVVPPQIQLLTTLAEIAGNSIHRAQLYEQSEEQVRRLTALRDVDTAIASSFDLRVTLNILLDHTLAQLNVDAAAITTYNTELHTLNHIASLGFYQSSNIQAPVRINNRLLNEAFLERKDLFVENIAGETGHPRQELSSKEKFVSYYASPLISKGQVKGLLEVFLRKPLIPEADWADFFHTMAGQAAIAIDNSQLFDNLQRSNQELSLAYDTTLEGWGKALELRDKETQGHTLRVTDLTLRLSRRMGIPETDLIHIRRGVLLHDIGKMAVPDNILKKIGPLTEDEWKEMRLHPQYAYELLYPIAYLRPVLNIPYAHHEYWNGTGYPRGLKGEEIPLAARIFAVVDVYDALLYDRPYRKAWQKGKVIEYLISESGTHFDPTIVHEFLQMISEDDKKMG